MPIKYWIRTRRTLVLFLGIMGIFVAGAGWLGWNFLQQDRELEEQRIRERLDNTADVVVAELRVVYSRFEQQLETLATLEPADIPEAAETGSAELATGAVIVHVTGVGVTAYPPERVLYYPMLPTGAEPPPATFAEGEDFEVGGQYEKAIASFRRLATADDPAVRAGALLRLARAYRHAGRTNEAEVAYRELAELGDIAVGGFPAGLLARWALCALLESEARLAELGAEARQLREGLLGGVWTIDRPTFLLYRQDADAFVARAAERSDEKGSDDEDGPVGEEGVSGGEEGVSGGAIVAPDDDSLSGALAIASGLDLLWREWSRGIGQDTRVMAPAGEFNGGGVGETVSGELALRQLAGVGTLILWRGTSESAVGLIAAPAFLRQQLFEPLQPLLERQSAALILGEPPDVTRGLLNARRTSAESGLPWELQVVSADPLADRIRLAGRRRLLLLVATLVAVVLVAGTYFSSRAVARELEVARLQSEFVAAVSHDFRTPLTSLRQVTDALVGDRVAEDRRRSYYDIQRRGIDRLHRLVEGLLDFGRMEAGVREFEYRPIAARQWIEELVRDFQVEVDKQGYTVELSWDGKGDGAEIEGDEPALTRALWNVLDNAVKYSPDCKTVWVDCRHDAGSGNGAGLPRGRSGNAGEAVIVSVRDRGLGIERDERDAIFDKFVRGSAAAGSPSSGTGLGLAMVRHIVDAHGGDIEIDGRPGEGTTFTIRLPMKPTS